MALGLLTLAGIQTAARGMVISSTEFSISGHWKEALYAEPDGNDEPDFGGPQLIQSSSGTFSRSSINGPGLHAAITSEPGGRSQASGSIDSFNLSMGGWAWPFDGVSESEIFMEASATTRFRTTGNRLDFLLMAGASYNYHAWEQDMQVILRDLTTGLTLLEQTQLDEYENSDEGDFFGNARYLTNSSQRFTLETDPAHEYELILSGQQDLWDAKDVDMRIWVQIEEFSAAPVAVPESGTTALMLAIAMTGIGWAGSRHSKGLSGPLP